MNAGGVTGLVPFAWTALRPAWPSAPSKGAMSEAGRVKGASSHGEGDLMRR